MSEEFKKNQNEEQESSRNELNPESGSFYHYSYTQNQNQNGNQNPNSQQGPSLDGPGKDPKKRPNGMKKRLAAVAAMALVAGVVGGTAFQASSYLESRYAEGNQVVQAAGSEESEEQLETEVAKAVDMKTEMTNLSQKSSSDEEYSVKEVAAYAMPSMVAITNQSVQEVQDYFFGQTFEREEESTGSGVIIGENEDELLVATNNHVVEGAQNLTVCFTVETENTDDLVVNATVKGTDPNHDLAIVSVKLSDISDDIKSKIQVMEVGNSDELELGEQVVAIGNALGYGQSVTSGYVSALDREVTVDGITNNLIQTDAAINPGNSGGALLNMKGQLIGINSVKASATGVEGMGYAIPIDTAVPIFDELKNIQSRDKVDEDQRGYMGMKPADVTSEAKQIYNMPAGAFVYEVTEGSAAEKAGLKRGDIITKMDGVIIGSTSDLYDRMEYYAAGDELNLTVERADGGEYKEQELTLILDKKPVTTTTSNSGSGQDGQEKENGGRTDEEEGQEMDPFSQIFPEYFRH